MFNPSIGGAQVARRYVNPAKSVALVTESTLAEAQQRLDEARGRLREAEGSPAAPGWDAECDAAAAAVRGAERRLEALTTLRAAQLERSGQRADTVKASAKELSTLAAALGASRDQVAAAAAGHLRALAALASAVDAHNGKLAAGRARLAALGLAVRDDLVGHRPRRGASRRRPRPRRPLWRERIGRRSRLQGLVTHALLETFGRFRGAFSGPRHAWPAYRSSPARMGCKCPPPRR